MRKRKRKEAKAKESARKRESGGRQAGERERSTTRNHLPQPLARGAQFRGTRYARSVMSATSCNSASFSHCASGVMMLPSDVEANPHCVATHSFSTG